jgi:hypothetical protein
MQKEYQAYLDSVLFEHAERPDDARSHVNELLDKYEDFSRDFKEYMESLLAIHQEKTKNTGSILRILLNTVQAQAHEDRKCTCASRSEQSSFKSVSPEEQVGPTSTGHREAQEDNSVVMDTASTLLPSDSPQPGPSHAAALGKRAKAELSESQLTPIGIKVGFNASSSSPSTSAVPNSPDLERNQSSGEDHMDSSCDSERRGSDEASCSVPKADVSVPLKEPSSYTPCSSNSAHPYPKMDINADREAKAGESASPSKCHPTHRILTQALLAVVDDDAKELVPEIFDAASGRSPSERHSEPRPAVTNVPAEPTPTVES